MRTTLKNVEELAKSLGMRVDRPADYWINIRAQNNAVMYTAQSTQEAWAWLQGYRVCKTAWDAEVEGVR